MQPCRKLTIVFSGYHTLVKHLHKPGKSHLPDYRSGAFQIPLIGRAYESSGVPKLVHLDVTHLVWGFFYELRYKLPRAIRSRPVRTDIILAASPEMSITGVKTLDWISQETTVKEYGPLPPWFRIAKVVAGHGRYFRMLLQELQEVFRLKNGIGIATVNLGKATGKFSLEDLLDRSPGVLEDVVVDYYKTRSLYRNDDIQMHAGRLKPKTLFGVSITRARY